MLLHVHICIDDISYAVCIVNHLRDKYHDLYDSVPLNMLSHLFSDMRMHGFDSHRYIVAHFVPIPKG